jgi:hypothetical protein
MSLSPIRALPSVAAEGQTVTVDSAYPLGGTVCGKPPGAGWARLGTIA